MKVKGVYPCKDDVRLIQAIIEVSCQITDTKVELVLGRLRTQHVAFVRHLCMALIYKKTKFTLNEVGQVFGRDHTTIINAIKRIDIASSKAKHKEIIIKVLTELKKRGL